MKRAVIAPSGSVTLSETLAPPWPGYRITIDGVATHLRETPPTADGTEPALFVHGLGGSSSNWTDLAGLLAHRLDGYAMDLPGFGRSDPARSYSIGALAERVARVIEHTGRGPVHLFGNSLGGSIVVRVAALRPDLVRTLTLISPAMPFLDARRSAHARMLPFLLIPRADRLAARRMATIPPDQLARDILQICFADPTRIAEQRMAEAIEEAQLRYDVPWYLDAYVRTLRSLIGSFLRAYLPGSGSLWRLAAQIAAPTLVIGGDSDRLVDIRVAAQAARTIPDSRLLMLRGVGHVAQMEVPELVARSVVGLLDEVHAARTADMAR
ncbi:alpha/beta fold hydrolase [Rugosimonospora africana]|uniref:Hydrolase n=1 Tax=Rugosimonospora africana TaxID=556532 RepID=A0A8J3QMA6_9ACTN|nr:alpha/beta hydrolase [Rugosimonospora africana]GIH12514.1 hydrolase [Rugosimonospora africana]